jgi:PAS domain S-box-containing protein
MSEGPRTLLLDDNPDDRALVVRELKRVFPALQAHEAIDQRSLTNILRGPAFDLVITDFQLRWTDGLAVLRSVKTRWPDCPVIMFTGTGSEEVAVQAMKAGLDDYVLKSPQHYKRLPKVARLVLQVAHEKHRVRQVEARHSLLFASVPVGLYRASPEGKILDANPALAEMLRCPDATKLVGANLQDLYLQSQRYEEWHERMQRQSVVSRHEAQLRTFDGQVCWVENSARAVREPRTGLVYEGSLENTTERKEAEDERERLIEELQEALAKVRTLGGLLPICASCKKIRDDKGYWSQIEEFIQTHSDAEFTHSFCPDCVKALYPEVLRASVKVDP